MGIFPSQFTFLNAVLQVHAIIPALLAQPSTFQQGNCSEHTEQKYTEIRLEFSFPCQAVFQLKKKRAYKLAENNKVF